jgi:hypothetical protein
LEEKMIACIASRNARAIWPPCSQLFWSRFIALASNLFSFAYRSGKLASNETAASPVLVSLACALGKGQGNSKNSAA